jgi:acetyl-CoA carboxylase biotin carboxyl carrier protein
MKIEELGQLVRWLEEARTGALEIESDNYRLRMTLRPDTTQADPISVTIDDGEGHGAGVVVAANLPGIFLLRHPQRATPIVPLGAVVRAGDLVGLIQVGALYAPVIAASEGRVARILAVPQTLVGFGTPLFEIVPAASS